MMCTKVIADFLIVFTIVLCMDTVISQKGCHANERVFVEVGSNATFIESELIEHLFPYHEFYFEHGTNTVLYVEVYRSDVMSVSDATTQKRIYVFVKSDSGSDIMKNITIILQNVNDLDNGTYTLGDYMNKGDSHCWTLFVLKQPTTPKITPFLNTKDAYMIEEGEPVSFSGSRSTSRSIPAGLSVTMAWLVDGFNVSSSQGLYQVSNDGLLILHTDRRLNGKNVTYRATEESGKTNEANYTLSIAYGPDTNLILKPETCVLFLTEGEDISTVTCTATCSPTCITIWTSDKLSENITGRQLTLGKAAVSMSGNYACVATRAGTYKTAKRIITVEVKVKATVDNTSVIVLGSLLGITTVGLVALAVYVLRRQMLPCIPGVKEKKRNSRKNMNSRGRTTTPQGISNDVAMDTYTDLQSDRRDVHVETIYDPIETGVIQTGQITYENTSLPKLKYES